MKYYVDWDGTNLWVLDDQDFRQQLKGWALVDFIEIVEPGDTVYIEDSFESYSPKHRNNSIREAEERDVILRGMNTRATFQILKEFEAPLAQENSWERNVYAMEAIREYVRRGRHTDSPRMFPEHNADLRWDYEERRRTTGFKQKDQWVQSMLAPMNFGLLSQEEQSVLGPKKFDLEFVLSMVVCAREATSKQDFDLRLGAHDTRYGNFYSSQFSRRAMTLTKRELRTRSIKNIPRNTWHPVWKKHARILRRAVRHIYWSQRGKELPENGNVVPPATSSSQSQRGKNLPENGKEVPPATYSRGKPYKP